MFLMLAWSEKDHGFCTKSRLKAVNIRDMMASVSSSVSWNKSWLFIELVLHSANLSSVNMCLQAYTGFWDASADSSLKNYKQPNPLNGKCPKWRYFSLQANFMQVSQQAWMTVLHCWWSWQARNNVGNGCCSVSDDTGRTYPLLLAALSLAHI